MPLPGRFLCGNTGSILQFQFSLAGQFIQKIGARLVKKYLLWTCIILAEPALAKERTVIQTLPPEYVANVNIVSVDLVLQDSAIESVSKADDRAEDHSEKLQQSSNSPPLQSRKSYATLPTLLMVSEMMTDRLRGWDFTSGRDVRLRVTVDTVKLANKGNIVFGKPNPTSPLLDIFFSDSEDASFGSEDEIAGVVDIIDVASKKRVGSYYIDVVNDYGGSLGLVARGRNAREKLAEEFSLETARCLATGNCKRGKWKPK
jgi:hypothetical protein